MFPRNRYLLILDLTAFPIIAILSFYLRLETLSRPGELSGILVFILSAIITKVGLFLLGGVYQRYWRNAGTTDLLLIWEICAVSTLISFLTWLVIPAGPNDFGFAVPRSVPLIDGALTVIYASVSRFSERAFNYWRLTSRTRGNYHGTHGKRLLIIGAGTTGIQVLESLASVPTNMQLIGFLDDDPSKVGNFVREFKVLGRLADLGSVALEQHIETVIIAMPSAPGSTVRQVVQACRALRIEHRIVPGTAELATGRVSVSSLRSIRIEDLLRREPVRLDVDHIRRLLSGKRIMVTGAGGSIGSELVRQIAGMSPAKLILVGRGENSLFLVENQLRASYPGACFETHLVDIRREDDLRQVFEETQPQIVFHAAAHKHVPMLETNLVAAVSNNVLGTQAVINLCNAFSVERMVLLSTDKAVEPASVMGMTKRVAELLILRAGNEHPGRFAAVRFGNVLGSRGSVVPTFQRQIQEGGPVTVTSDTMTRFFMSIPEAALLVLKAAAHIDQGPLFVLNMGAPVRIVDLACELIRLSGLEPERDIEVRVTGLRPGEKMHEALVWDFEDQHAIENGAVYCLRLSDAHLAAVREGIQGCVEALAACVNAERPADNQLRAQLRSAAYLIPGRAIEPTIAPDTRSAPLIALRAVQSNPAQTGAA